MIPSPPPTPSDLHSDFGPLWSSRLSTTIPSNPELAIIEQEAWKDQAYYRDSEPPTSRDGDSWTSFTQAEPSFAVRNGLITPPDTPGKGVRIHGLMDGEESGREEDVTEDEEEEEGGDDTLVDVFESEQWALVKYMSCHGIEDRGLDGATETLPDADIQGLAGLIVFAVFLVVVLHGMWLHWNESEKGLGCRCDCLQPSNPSDT